MKETIGDLTRLAQSRTQSFFMYKGIPYDITEMYEDEGKWYVAGISDDGEVATQRLCGLRKEQKIRVLGPQLNNNI